VRNPDPPPTEPRDPQLAQAEADVERARERVAQSVLALRNEVARRTDWREWFRGRPVTFLAAAFALGFLVGRQSRHHDPNPKTRRRSTWR
jgi:hypothetical protein